MFRLFLVPKLKHMKFKVMFVFALCGHLYSCGDKSQEIKSTGEANPKIPEMTFKAVPDSISGVRFKNVLKEDNRINYFTYQYMYMGGGVSIGDINNDGLPDIFFTGNRVKNKLYLNKGDMQFEDITETAGLIGDIRWYTGVSMADVNNDGLLDIYACVSGPFTETKNQLYINNGDLTFTESAEEYGINVSSPSVQASFFDYDNDGDLDMYLANYPPTPFRVPNSYYAEKLKNPADNETDQFFRNEGNKGFVEVTNEVGIRNFGLSLSASVSDYNNDGWQDVYVSNDFNSPDFLYINQGDGTFKDEIKSYTQHTSNFGMGSDAADINNDGFVDFMQLDMMAENNKKQKTNMASMNPAKFNEAVDLGLHYQYMRNCLQLNNGNGSFSDIAELAGVSSTDWSWGVLLMDMDNDGWKDIFISNGMRRNVNDKDFNIAMQKKKQAGLIDKNRPFDLVSQMDEVPVHNFTYRNNKDLTFEKKIKEWGIDFKGFTNGIAYGDLDADGDLDLVLNNLDDMSAIFENNASSRPDGNFLSIKLKGEKDNHFGLGAKVYVETNGKQQLQEMMLTRGFQSSVEPILHFGLGTEKMVDELRIEWPDGTVQTMNGVKAGQQLVINQKGEKVQKQEFLTQYFQEKAAVLNIDYKHTENEYDDFKKEVLLPHKMSQFGPSVAVADINGDGREDFYVGGSAGKKGALYLQNVDGKFTKKASRAIDADKACEDIDALFFDLENDGDMDLYIVSGGNEFEKDAKELQDRLYVNDGKGNFKKSDGLPEMISSGACVAANDYDGDGDNDLFVGGRLVPAKYPFPARSYLLENNGGKFTDVTSTVAPDLLFPGMVTSAIWTDFNQDGKSDLMLTGEWMPIRFMEQKNNQFVDQTSSYGFENTTGWWFSLEKADMDGDGDDDYVVGNLGANYKYKATEKEPFHVYANDFDNNGKMDIVLGYYNQGKAYPVRGLQCSSEQCPTIKNKFKSYDAFGSATLDMVYGADNLNASLHYEANIFESCYIENKGNGNFKLSPLPKMAQLSSVNSLLLHDFDGDGNKDILLAGNIHGSEVETPRNDAGTGLWLKGDGNGQFTPVTSRESGFYAPHVVNNMKLLKKDNELIVLVGNNDEKMQSFVVSRSGNIALKE